VALNWAKPISDGGGRINGFYVEKRDVSGPQLGAVCAAAKKWQRCNLVPLPACAHNVPNLLEEHEYEFREFAENEAGLRIVRVKDPLAATRSEINNKILGVLILIIKILFNIKLFNFNYYFHCTRVVLLGLFIKFLINTE
jgi:hypothetical protein